MCTLDGQGRGVYGVCTGCTGCVRGEDGVRTVIKLLKNPVKSPMVEAIIPIIALLRCVIPASRMDVRHPSE